METTETKFKKVDVLPIVKYYMDQLGIYDLFNEFIPQGKCLIPTAQVLCIMVINIICAGNPLYKIEEWLVDYTDGVSEISNIADLFNDDRCGRSLDKLFDSERSSMMTRLAVTAMRIHELLASAVHNDSTSLTLMGKYNRSDPGAVRICHGHNKDFRPDCKQVVFGLNITEDGHVPLSYHLFDGNQSDDTTHIANWESLRKLIDKEDFIYIADCKLCSIENLNYIHLHHGQFITLAPENRAILRPFEQRLLEGNVVWYKAYSIADSRDKNKAITYYFTDDDITDSGYRLIWIKSDAKVEQDAARREKKITKTETNLKELRQKLNRRNLKTKEQINNAISQSVKGCKDCISIQIQEHSRIIKKKRTPGRSGPNSQYDTIIEPYYEIEFSRNEKVIKEKAAMDGIFPLITNTKLPAPEVLRHYKDQPYLEKRFSTFKSVLEIAPIFLEKPKRIEAMVFLYFIALMLVSLIERHIRKQMVTDNIEKLPILPQGMNTKKPTWNNIQYLFRNVHLSVTAMNQQIILTKVKGLTELHITILKLLGVPDVVYTQLHDGWYNFDTG